MCQLLYAIATAPHTNAIRELHLEVPVFGGKPSPAGQRLLPVSTYVNCFGRVGRLRYRFVASVCARCSWIGSTRVWSGPALPRSRAAPCDGPERRGTPPVGCPVQDLRISVTSHRWAVGPADLAGAATSARSSVTPSAHPCRSSPLCGRAAPSGCGPHPHGRGQSGENPDDMDFWFYTISMVTYVDI